MVLNISNNSLEMESGQITPDLTKKSKALKTSSTQENAFKTKPYQAQVDAFEQTPFFNRSPQERVAFLKKKQDRGETLTALVFDSFYQEESDGDLNSPEEQDRLERKRDKQSDINVDGYLDKVMHGDLVAAFNRSNGVRVIPADISGVRPEQQNDSLYTLSKRREEWISKIERGEIKVDIVQLSLNPPYTSKGEWKKMTYADLERLSGVSGITPENLHEKEEAIMKAFEARYKASRRSTEAERKDERKGKKGKSKNSQAVNDLIFIEKTVGMDRHVQRLNRVEVTTVVSGGNAGLVNTSDETINAYSLGKHVVSVGALDEFGNKAAFSADHSLITHRRPGVYTVKTLKDGIDITGDNIPDFPLSILNFDDTEPLFEGKKFKGKKLSEVQGKITPEIEKRAKTLRGKHDGIIPKKAWKAFLEDLEPDKLYSNMELNVLRGRLSRKELKLAKYANLSFYCLPNSKLKMIENEDGVLDYDTRRKGTSYAAPLIP